MDQFVQLLEEFVMKAIVQTEAALSLNLNNGQQLEAFTENRDRLFMVIDQISRQINWNEVEMEKREEFSRQIDYIKKLDEKLLVKLQEYKESLRSEIEQNFRQKENLKGYNLNNVK